MFSLNGKVAVVSGANQGIGLAVTKRFLKAGAKVIMADIVDGAEKIAEELGTVFVKTDVSKAADMENLMKTAVETYGRLDIIINNAGVSGGSETSIYNADPREYEKCFKINTMGVVYGLKYAYQYMNDGGSIVNTASAAGITGFPGYGAYSSSKSAVVQMTKTAAIEFAPRKIRVNCFCPTTVNTPMAMGEDGETEMKMAKSMYPLGRICEPEEIAALAHFLSSDDCTYITGQIIGIDGGYTAGTSLGLIDAVIG